MAVLTWFSNEILPPHVAGDFSENGEHSDLVRIKTGQIPLQLNDDKATIAGLTH